VPKPSISKEAIQEIKRLRREESLTSREIGERVGVHHATAAKYMKDVKPKPAPAARITDSVAELQATHPCTETELMAAFGLNPRRWIPHRFNIGVSRHGPRGSMSCKRIISEELEHLLVQFFREQQPLARPDFKTLEDIRLLPQILAWGLWDAHLGMYAWNAETGADWDVEIAVNRVYNSIDAMCTEIAPYGIREVLLPIGNDFMHFDSVRNKTALGEHSLDVDTRFARVYLACLKCLCYMTERALDFAPLVRIFFIPGNHDTTVAFTLCAALAQRYMNDPRVVVDLRANPRKGILHGKTFLAFDHGAYAKAERLALAVLTENAEMVGKSVYREVQVGHKHQSRETMYHGLVPTNGINVRMNPSLCNADIWHHRQGFTDPVKTVEAYRYDERGFRGNHVATADDNPNPNLGRAKVVPGGPNWRESLEL
jgi:hypothetical protein